MSRPFAAACLGLLLCSCATTSIPYRELTSRDGTSADEAVLAIQVVVIAPDDRFVAEEGWRAPSPFTLPHPILHLLLEDGDGYRTLDIPLSMESRFWQSVDGRYRYARDVVAHVPSGTYVLKVLELYLGTTYGSSTKTEYYQQWYPRLGFVIGGPGTYGLGSLVLSLDTIEGTQPGAMTFESRLQLDQGAGALEANAAAVTGRSPLLGAALEPLPVRFAYSLVTPPIRDDVLDRREDTLWPNASSDRIEAGFEGGLFYIRKKVSDDRVDFVRPSSPVRLPLDCDLAWDARLINGEAGKRYGMMLGADVEDCLVVAASDTGEVTILRRAGGAWKRLREPVPSAAKTMASGGTNAFLVSVRGGRAACSVNGVPLGEFEVPWSASGVFLAPYLESRGILSISRLRITGAP